MMNKVRGSPKTVRKCRRSTKQGEIKICWVITVDASDSQLHDAYDLWILKVKTMTFSEV